jgi:hypothetical protein
MQGFGGTPEGRTPLGKHTWMGRYYLNGTCEIGGGGLD